jgi:Flp pilus assembly protein protease CpaA
MSAIAFGISCILTAFVAVNIILHDIKYKTIPNKWVLYQLLISFITIIALQAWTILGIWVLSWMFIVGLGVFFGSYIEAHIIGYGDLKYIVTLLPLVLILNQALLFGLLLAAVYTLRAVLRKQGAFAPMIVCALVCTIFVAFI